MFGSLDISASGLVAQRTRLDVIASNVANRNSIVDADGNYSPFRRRLALFSPGDPSSGRQQGVHVQEIRLDDSPFLRKYEPDSPYAAEDGYVEYPNIDPMMEMVNAIDASRAYEANIAAAEAAKTMMQNSLRLLA